MALNIKTMVSTARGQLRKEPHFNLAAAGLIPVAKQLGECGNRELGIYMLVGIAKGLGKSKPGQYPVCPFCGQRHRPNPKVAQMLGMKPR